MGKAALAVLALLAFAASPLDESTTVAGLRDALSVASQRAVQTVSATDGFFADPKIRIPLPGKLESMASGLRALGMGAQVDERIRTNPAARSTDLLKQVFGR
jgi:hypothetical protein